VLILVVGGTLYLWYSGQTISIPFQAGVQSIVTPAGDGQITISGSSQNPSLVFTTFDQKTLSSVDSTIELWKNTGSSREYIGSEKTVSGSATFSNLDPNTQYVAEVSDVNSGFIHYGKMVEVATLNAGSKTITVPIITGTQSADVPTITIYNNDDVTTNAFDYNNVIRFDTNTLNLGSNDTKTARIRIRPASTTNDNNYFGGGLIPIVCVADFNSLRLSSITAKFGDSSLSTTGVPSGHIVPDLNHTSKIAFALPVSSMKPATDYDLKLTFKSSTAPALSVDFNCNANGYDLNFDSVQITCYDGCRTKNTNTGEYVNVYRDPVDLSNICASNIGYATVYLTQYTDCNCV